MAIRTCYFDMGNVLVFFSHDRMCENVAKLANWPVTKARTFLFEDGRQWKLERGEMSEVEFHDEFCRAVGQPISIDQLLNAAADIFVLNDLIVPILHELRLAGQRLVLLSNTSLTHIRFIERHWSVLQLMHERVVSYEVGAMKPDERIFAAALAKAECEPCKCFYTDDMEPFIVKGRELGFVSHQFSTAVALRQELCRLKVLQ